MDVMEAIKTRKSVRRFLDKPLEEEKIRRVLEAGRLAPSNRQEWRYIIVRDGELRKRIAEAANRQKFVGEAPVIIVACAVTDNHLMDCGQLCYPIDVAISLDHISLEATELGLGTCWIGAFSEDQIKQILGIPRDVRVVGLMPLGYPVVPSPVKKNRLPLERIVRYDHW
jgi:nitroreductase